MFLSDLRDLRRKSAPEIHLVMQLFSHFAPNLAKKRANLKDPSFGAVVLPVKFQDYTSDIICLGEFPNANQLMANYVSEELIEESRFPATRLTLAFSP